jgi:hypothetical protein
MMFPSFLKRKTRLALIPVIVFLFNGVFTAGTSAVTRFSSNTPYKEMPAVVDIHDIWFYDADRSKTVPAIDHNWIAVAFRSSVSESDSPGSAVSDQDLIKENAKVLLSQHDELIDFYYDQTLADDACFFKLRPDMASAELMRLLTRINEHDLVSYAHPTLKIQDGTFAFFNAFTLIWKTGVSEDEKTSVLNQLPVSFDGGDQIYRVDIHQKPFFSVLNLIAQDIRVAKAEPYLVEIYPTIHGGLAVAIAGGNLGDRIPFSLRINFSPRAIIDPSSLATINLRPENIQKELFDIVFDPYDYTKAVLNSPIFITGQMRFYAPGDFTIPPVDIKYHCPECSTPQDRTFRTEPVHVRISSIVPPALQESNLIIPQKPLDVELPIASLHRLVLRNLFIACVCLALAIIGIIWCLFRRSALNKEKQKLLNEKQEERIGGRLRLLLTAKADGDPMTLLSDINKLFRDYLIYRFHVSPAPAGGAGTVFWETIKDRLPEDISLKIKDILEHMDQTAARERFENTDMESIRNAVIEALDLTTIQPSNE